MSDPGKLQYRIHNIYLNFLETYQRLPPDKPITLHQKALFTFWMSTILIWTTMQLYRLHNMLRARRESRDPLDEMNVEEMEITETFIPITTNSKSIQSSKQEYLPLPQESHITYSPNKKPHRKDYLDEGAFTLDEDAMSINESAFTAKPNTTISLTELTMEAKLNDAHNVRSKLNEGLTLLDEEQVHKEEVRPKEKAILNKLSQLAKSICTAHDKEQPSFEQFLSRTMIFGCFMFYIWLVDYLHIWPKVNKQYSRDMFVFLFFVLVLVAVGFTIKKTKDKLLNRDQTEEWKGWMQVQFVWYHYYDAEETFNSIRCYVGAYVWMTGFGNYIYFSTRKDYSIFRLLKMLFRLNFLVFCIMAVTNHEFVRYYICAMHTYWFLSVWAVMVAFNRYNGNFKFILLKFAIYFAINAMIFNIPGASEKVFTPFKWALHDAKGTLRYWKYRAWLDQWSTLVGMLVAFNFERIENFLKYLDKDEEETKQQRETLRYTVTGVLLAIFAAWFYYILRKPKAAYLEVHPFTSPIPIVIYTWLRNLHPVLRTHYLNLFTWLGKITLETYLSQIHIYMMGDAKAIVAYLPRYPMLNFALSTIIYISVSYILFKLTVFFSSYIFPRNCQIVIKNILLGFLWLGSCYVLSYLLTHAKFWNTEISGLEFLLWNINKY